MNAPAFTFAPAVRERVSLLIAIAGASGSGKTKSGLMIARGLAGGNDERIAVIDTEARRALHYAVPPGGRPGPDHFAFSHCDMRPPFSPDAYMAAIDAADRAGFEVIMIDSCSHEYEGDGGLHDMHDAIVARDVEKARAAHNGSYPFDEIRAAEKASVGAWKEPKARHKRFVSRLLQCRAHLVLCLRADEKIRIDKVTEKGSNGREYTKTVIVQPKDMPPNERWVPICEKRFMYEMTMSLVVTPQAPGMPIPIKLQAQHRAAVPLDKPLSEETGRALGMWAAGGATQSSVSGPGFPSLHEGPAEGAGEAPASQASPVASSSPEEDESRARFINETREHIRAATDYEDLGRWWNSELQKKLRRDFGLSAQEVESLKAFLVARLEKLKGAGK